MNYPPKPDDPRCPYPKTEGVKRLWSAKKKQWYGIRESDNEFVTWYGSGEGYAPNTSTETMSTSENGQSKKPRILECSVVSAPSEPVDLELYEALQHIQYMLVSVQNILLGLIKKDCK